jgi:opacity protein-like surface antigen
MLKSIRTLLLAGASTVVVAGSAHAADIIPVAETSWTGFYIGAGGGGSFAFADMGAAGYGYFGTEDWDCWSDEDCDGPSPSWQPYGSGSSDDDISGIVAAAAGFGNSGNAASALNGLLANLNNLDDDDGDQGKAGFFGRIEAGYDYQLSPQFLIGINAGFSFGKTEISGSGEGAGGGLVSPGFSQNDLGFLGGGGGGGGEVDADVELGNNWSIGARAGFLPMDNVLLFITGGYTQIDADISASFRGIAAAGAGGIRGLGGGLGADWNIDSSHSEWLDGFYVGGGVETLLTESISLKFEYRFADYGSIETSSEASAGASDIDDGDFWAAGTGVSAEADIYVHSVFATLNWRF